MKQAMPVIVRLYRYVGDGQGVAGLPHEITDLGAQARGLFELLWAAIENGSYQEVTAAKEVVDLTVITDETSEV